MNWQPIETAPKDGTSVLLLYYGVLHQGAFHGPSDGAIYSGRSSQYNWVSESAGGTLFDGDVTHWMPLPQPPA